MKKLLVIFSIFILISCGKTTDPVKENTPNKTEEKKIEEKIEEKKIEEKPEEKKIEEKKVEEKIEEVKVDTSFEGKLKVKLETIFTLCLEEKYEEVYKVMTEQNKLKMNFYCTIISEHLKDAEYKFENYKMIEISETEKEYSLEYSFTKDEKQEKLLFSFITENEDTFLKEIN